MGCDQRQLYGGNVRQDLCLRRARKLARTLRSLGAAAQTNAKTPTQRRPRDRATDRTPGSSSARGGAVGREPVDQLTPPTQIGSIQRRERSPCGDAVHICPLVEQEDRHNDSPSAAGMPECCVNLILFGPGPIGKEFQNLEPHSHTGSLPELCGPAATVDQPLRDRPVPGSDRFRQRRCARVAIRFEASRYHR